MKSMQQACHHTTTAWASGPVGWCCPTVRTRRSRWSHHGRRDDDLSAYRGVAAVARGVADCGSLLADEMVVPVDRTGQRHGVGGEASADLVYREQGGALS